MAADGLGLTLWRVYGARPFDTSIHRDQQGRINQAFPTKRTSDAT